MGKKISDFLKNSICKSHFHLKQDQGDQGRSLEFDVDFEDIIRLGNMSFLVIFQF